MAKFTINELQELIDEESLSYVIDTVSPSRIRDLELGELWDEARDLLLRIQEHMDQNAGEDEDDFLDEDEDYN